MRHTIKIPVTSTKCLVDPHSEAEIERHKKPQSSDIYFTAIGITVRS